MIEGLTSMEVQGAEQTPPTQPDPTQQVTPEGLQVVNEQQVVAEIMRKYDQRRQMRKPYEIQWYMNASALRGFPDVRFNAELNRLEVKREPAHRKRFRIPRIKAKYIARVSKFTKIPPHPTVVPATTDREDIMNAKASQKALEYAMRKLSLQKRYMQAMRWVPVTGKCFWWVRWDDKTESRTMVEGKGQPILGDVALDFGSAFEFLPADPGIELLEDQPEIMRIKIVHVKEIEAKYPEQVGKIKGESTDADIFFYQRQIADIGTRQSGIASRAANMLDEEPQYVVRIECFTKPCAEYPQGRYVVVAGQRLLRMQLELPGGFHRCHSNPYPCVEFQDDAAPGQFWPDAFVERLIGIQSEYNEYRSKVGENLALHFFPKLFTPRQANLPPDSYTSEAGEKIEFTWAPGIPQPYFLQPQGVLGDAWNILQTITKEFDELTLIYPAALGGAGGATSGFQTNLLQEAADQVHGPAIQANAEALREAFIKIRHLMKIGYDIPRMISVAGKNNIPEVYEFSAQTIDEYADIIVEADSMMPTLKSARVDMITQMFEKGVWGNPADPKVTKKVQNMLRMGNQDFEVEKDQRDEEQAQTENVKMIKGEPLPKPMPWENHIVHWEAHTDLFKSPEAQLWTPEQLQANIWHALVHLNYANPTDAMYMAAEFGMLEPLLQLQQLHAQVDAMLGPPPMPGGDPNQPQPNQQDPSAPPPSGPQGAPPQ